MLSKIVCLSTLCLLGVLGQQPLSRSVSRSADGGRRTANLVEFSARGVTYGRCSFRSGGEDITAIYEERGTDMIAATSNPTIVDPVSKARMCREYASKLPPSQSQSRSEFGEPTLETEMELLNGLKEFETKIGENQQYVNQLKPRFIALLSELWSQANKDAFSFSFGSPGVSNLNLLNWFGKRR